MGGASFIATTQSVPPAASRATAVPGSNATPSPRSTIFLAASIVELHHATQSDPGGEEGGLSDLVVARRAVEHDQLLGGNVGHRDGAPIRERVIRGADEDELLGMERPQLQVWMVDGSAEADLHLVVKNKVGDVL
ncbi:MAG: hypothetical protein NVS9B11_10870 [Candidatus Dormibacteraceae bacterium]